jgi:hypothetical protein
MPYELVPTFASEASQPGSRVPRFVPGYRPEVQRAYRLSPGIERRSRSRRCGCGSWSAHPVVGASILERLLEPATDIGRSLTLAALPPYPGWSAIGVAAFHQPRGHSSGCASGKRLLGTLRFVGVTAAEVWATAPQKVDARPRTRDAPYITVPRKSNVRRRGVLPSPALVELHETPFEGVGRSLCLGTASVGAVTDGDRSPLPIPYVEFRMPLTKARGSLNATAVANAPAGARSSPQKSAIAVAAASSASGLRLCAATWLA